jgi:hypothetical protein
LARSTLARLRGDQDTRMSHPLEGPWAKADRARVHLEALDDAIAKFIAGKPYTTTREIDAKATQRVIWIEVRDPPTECSVLAGDCVHNMRSSLDHLAWQLAIVSGGNPGRECQFPIFTNKDEFEHGRLLPGGRRGRAGRSMIREGKSSDAVRLIEDVQPYKYGMPAWSGLAMIETLSNIDKHRLLIKARLYAEAITPGKAECAVNFGPYEGRMQLAVCPLSTPDEEFDANVGTHITVAFGGGQIPRLAEGLTRVLEGR